MRPSRCADIKYQGVRGGLMNLLNPTAVEQRGDFGKDSFKFRSVQRHWLRSDI